MKLRLLSVLAAVTLVTACESTPQKTPSVPDTVNHISKNDGPVPTSTVLPQGEFELAVSQDRIFFDVDKYVIRPDAKIVLTRWADWIKQHPQHLMTLEGHADERGTREYNLAIGEKRANAVKEFLISHGVSPDQITTLSYGKERPAVSGAGENSWAQNRRTVAVVSMGSAL